MNLINKLKITNFLALVAACCMFSGNANAGLVSCDDSTIDNVQSGTFLACAGAFNGNDDFSNPDVVQALSGFINNFGLQGVFTYDSADKSDEVGFGIFTSNPEVSSGTLTFDAPVTGVFAIGLKAANSFSLFLFEADPNGINSFDFTTNGVSVNNNGRPRDLSHASFFRFEEETVQASTPFTAFLLLPALVFVLRKRRA